MGEWQPIESAPRDGTWFRVRGRDWGLPDKKWHRGNAKWGIITVSHKGRGINGWINEVGEPWEYASHWKPL